MSTTHPLRVTAPPGLPFVDTEREFDAPVDVVFRAHVEADLVRQWLGPHGTETVIDTYDARTGGRYRYVHRDASGAEHAFNGVFHAVVPAQRIVQTFEYEPHPEAVSLDTVTFTDLGDGRTRLSGRTAFGSVEARDGLLDSGMESGVREGYERLDALLARG